MALGTGLGIGSRIPEVICLQSVLLQQVCHEQPLHWTGLRVCGSGVDALGVGDDMSFGMRALHMEFRS